MTRKNGRKSRDASRRRRLQSRLFTIERGLFRAAGMAVFLFIILGFVYVGLASNIQLVAAGAGIAIFVWGSVVLPTDRFRRLGVYLWDGSFGEDVSGILHSLWPGNRRGQTSMRAFAAFAIISLCLSTAIPALLATGAVAQSGDGNSTSDSCQASVYYDEFRTDSEVVEEANKSGSATVVEKNTRVRINESDAFYRVRAENPNSYCVNMTIEVSGEIFPAANLGDVESLDGETTAQWTDVTNFDSQTAYTEVTVSVPANSTIRLAPSKPTVFLPAWRDGKKRQAEGYLERVKEWSPFGGNESGLEKRVYRFNGTEYDTMTIRLDNPNPSKQRIEGWDAMYRLSEDEPWKPVDTDTTDPVYYSKPSEDKLSFTFNDESATVEFRANPDTSDDVLFNIRSYMRSIHDLLSWVPLTTSPMGVPR